MLRSLLQNTLNLVTILLMTLLNGCTTVTIDETKIKNDTSHINQLDHGKSIVVVGRRSGSDYETEPDLIQCIGSVLDSSQSVVSVIPENIFVDKLYPWFEPRTAPIKIQDLFRLLEFQQITQAIEDFNIQYLVWVDGSTQTTNKSGQMSCSLGVTGVSCFGFGTWDKRADYEATIWDYSQRKVVGKINGTADGTSYMPAIVIPIPIIAPVQSDVCKAIGLQLRSFFNVDTIQPAPVTSADPNQPT